MLSIRLSDYRAVGLAIGSHKGMTRVTEGITVTLKNPSLILNDQKCGEYTYRSKFAARCTPVMVTPPIIKTINRVRRKTPDHILTYPIPQKHSALSINFSKMY